MSVDQSIKSLALRAALLQFCCLLGVMSLLKHLNTAIRYAWLNSVTSLIVNLVILHSFYVFFIHL